jgi:steroid 5-alpha reductase family enzyme
MAPVKEVKQRYEAIQRAAEQAIERIIQLMVVFVLQTILLPLLLLWALVRSTRSLPKIFQ